jgi:hypothetical protein
MVLAFSHYTFLRPRHAHAPQRLPQHVPTKHRHRPPGPAAEMNPSLRWVVVAAASLLAAAGGVQAFVPAPRLLQHGKIGTRPLFSTLSAAVETT